ncbi:oligosaccharide repeat unit polymerase [Enterococcus faecium]|uniref:oligosaccharide repeat unit polymerase n=1 Tax=Enterococcus faecium TaxID=1352 RepID=UPI003D2EEC10
MYKFLLFRGLTGKTARLDFGSTLFVYLGSPIPAFSQLVQNNISFVNEYWGSNVFIGIFELLGKFGYKINVGQEVAPNVNVGNLVTNIYGSFGRIYASFGLIGLFFIICFRDVLSNDICKFATEKSKTRIIFSNIFDNIKVFI